MGPAIGQRLGVVVLGWLLGSASEAGVFDFIRELVLL